MSEGGSQKWRPRLWTVVALVLGLVLWLPFAGLFVFKVYANQLVQQTEESLLSQASILSALYADLYAQASATDPGDSAPQSAAGIMSPSRQPAGRVPGAQATAPVFPSLSLGKDAILPRRPDARAPQQAPDPVYGTIAARLSQIADASQARTLAGYRLLDPRGTVIAGTAEIGQNLGHIHEISRALAGDTVSVARVRLRQAPDPVVYALSRGTLVWVFVAMPVQVGDAIVGAVYISRTPNHIFRFLYGERFNLAKALLFVILSTALIGFIFWRFITRPIHALIQRMAMSEGGQWRWQSPDHLGTREVENLSNSFQALSQRLQAQQDSLRSYTAHVTHELKSPLTALRGATELLRDGDMSSDQRRRFLDNVLRDADRMEDLLASMRAFSLADQTSAQGPCQLAQVVADTATQADGLRVVHTGADVAVPISAKALGIVLAHLAQNARQHGATRIDIRSGTQNGSVWITVSDDGRGISAGNRSKIFTPFFTTRRDEGGTGMGLNIITSILDTAGGQLTMDDTPGVTTFRMTFRATSV